LNGVRGTGDFEAWLLFFLRGVREVATEATDTARNVLQMRARHQEQVKAAVSSAHGPGFIDVLLRSPAVTVSAAADRLEVSYQTANTLIAELEKLGLVEEITGGARNRVFLYRPYLDVLGGEMPPS
jgi:Fic family protein